MSGASSILIILSDHDRRVRLRKLSEENFDVTVYSVANPLEGLDLLSKVGSVGFVLLSSQELPLMTYEEFLITKVRDPAIANIPVILLSTTPVIPLPPGVSEEVMAPIMKDGMAELIKKYCAPKTKEVQ